MRVGVLIVWICGGRRLMQVCAPPAESSVPVCTVNLMAGRCVCGGGGGGGGGISGHQSPEVYLFDQRQMSDVMEGGLGGGVGLGV